MGLKDVWDERQSDVEAVVNGHIEDCLSRHRHTEAASLARAMLSKSLQFTDKMFDYLSHTNRDLTECSGFPISNAWLLATEIVALIFKSLNSACSDIQDILAKSSPLRNTAHILYAMLRVHDVMDEYLTLEIKKSSIYIFRVCEVSFSSFCLHGDSTSPEEEARNCGKEVDRH